MTSLSANVKGLGDTIAAVFDCTKPLGPEGKPIDTKTTKSVPVQTTIDAWTALVKPIIQTLQSDDKTKAGSTANTLDACKTEPSGSPSAKAAQSAIAAAHDALARADQYQKKVDGT